jgi:hypothetical protein
MQPYEQRSDEPSRAEVIRLAHDSDLVVDGQLEIDEDAVVSFGGDNGAYIQAWLWVDFEGTALSKEPG